MYQNYPLALSLFVAIPHIILFKYCFTVMKIPQKSILNLMFTGPKLWNSLDQLLKEACSLNSFKYRLKMLFTEKY